MVRVASLRIALVSAVMLSAAGPWRVSAVHGNTLDRALGDTDLLDLLSAPLDEEFLTRDLQDITTGSPTPAPTPLDREIVATFTPTPGTFAPTGSPTAGGTAGGTAAATAEETSGASRSAFASATALLALALAAACMA